MIARLQMSDLHLGDDRSVLSLLDVVHKVAHDLAHLSGGHVGKLILAGDVWEESVPYDLGDLEDGIARSVLEASTKFFTSLFELVQVNEIVVVPGNHDLCTWQRYCKITRDKDPITSCEGVPVNPGEWPWRHLLAGYGGPLKFAYPLYWDKSAGDDYPVLFVTHGHLLDPLVLGDESMNTYVALAALGVRRPMGPPLEEVDSVAKLGEGTIDFCLELWKRYSPRDYAYSNYVMRRLDHPQSCLLQGSSVSWIDEANVQVDDPSPRQGNFANVARFLDLLIRDPSLPTPVGTLGGSTTDPAFLRSSCLTFGHDHRATFGRVVSCGVPFVAADSGGWTAEWMGHLPHAHVLVWNEVRDVVPAPYLVNLRRIGGR